MVMVQERGNSDHCFLLLLSDPDFVTAGGESQEYASAWVHDRS
jgi:hypothetical protein